MATLTVTLIQSDLHWEDKAANLRMFAEKIRNIPERTEVVILPEMFSTGFCMQPASLAETMDGETIEWMRKQAADRKIILAGSLIIKEELSLPSGHRGLAYYNRLVWMLPNGHCGFYDKRHRFAFGGEDEYYTAGSKRLIASVKGWKLNLLVCYDLRFPVWARQSPSSAGDSAKSPEYDVLVYVANWPEKRIHAWRTLLQARAIENQCYVVGVNRIGVDGSQLQYSGSSMVVDPLGEVILDKGDAEGAFTVTLQKDHLEGIREKFPFWKDADEFQIM